MCFPAERSAVQREQQLLLRHEAELQQFRLWWEAVSVKRTFSQKRLFKPFLLVSLFTALLLVAGCSTKSPLAGQAVTVYKSQTCGCCGLYVKYMGQKGLAAETVGVDDIAPIKTKYGIPQMMESCHTTVIGQYVVEGHMPIEAVEKLMSEKPDIKGIAMPGMPYGSPGMPGSKQEPFVIYALQNDGGVTEFMRI